MADRPTRNCNLCDDTGYKDYAGFAMDPCDHLPFTPAADTEKLLPANPAALERSIALVDEFIDSDDGHTLKPEHGESIMLCIHELKRLRSLPTPAADEVEVEAGRGWFRFGFIACHSSFENSGVLPDGADMPFTADAWADEFAEEVGQVPAFTLRDPKAIWEEACIGREGYCSPDLQGAAKAAIRTAQTEAIAAMQARSAEPASIERAAEALHNHEHPDASPVALRWSAFSEDWKEIYRNKARVAIDAYGLVRPAEPAGEEPVASTIGDIPEDIAAMVLQIGRAQWGQTEAFEAEGHAAHIAESVRLTDENFGQTGPRHMHGLYIEDTGTVICHTGTSPNSPQIARALKGVWNWLHIQATQSSDAQDRGEGHE